MTGWFFDAVRCRKYLHLAISKEIYEEIVLQLFGTVVYTGKRFQPRWKISRNEMSILVCSEISFLQTRSFSAGNQFSDFISDPYVWFVCRCFVRNGLITLTSDVSAITAFVCCTQGEGDGGGRLRTILPSFYARLAILKRKRYVDNETFLLVISSVGVSALTLAATQV